MLLSGSLPEAGHANKLFAYMLVSLMKDIAEICGLNLGNDLYTLNKRDRLRTHRKKYQPIVWRRAVGLIGAIVNRVLGQGGHVGVSSDNDCLARI
jgi:hypothetical protein